MRRSTNSVVRNGEGDTRSRRAALLPTMSDRFHGLSKIISCVLSLGFLSTLPFEVQRGSSVVAIYSQKGDYVVVAAESRTADMNHKPLDDRACKIISLGNDTVFFETGIPAIRVLR